jgi:hypothetical protein
LETTGQDEGTTMSDDQGWRREERSAALRSKDKDLTVYSLAGWTTGSFPNDGKLLGIEFLSPPPDMTTSIIRFVMTRDQCAALASALEVLARTPYAELPDEPG